MAKDESTQSGQEDARGLDRPPDDAVTETENILGGTGEDEEAEASQDDGAQTASESAPEDSENETPKRRRGRDRRIKKLTRRAHTAEQQLNEERRARQELEARIAELEAGGGSRIQKPQLKDYDSAEEYAEAYTEWKAKAETAAARKSKAKAPATRPQRVQNEELTSFIEEGKGLGDDWDKAMQAANKHQFMLTESMMEYLIDSDHGHAMFIALSKNPKLSREIATETASFSQWEMLQELEIKVDPHSRPEAKQRDEQGRFTGGEKKKQTKAPPVGPKKERGGPSTQNASYADLIPKTTVIEGRDLQSYMESRRAFNDRQQGRR